MIDLLTMILAAAVVGLVLLVVFFDRRSPTPKAQRVGLTMMAAGLLWAGPARALGRPAGLGDVLFLSGLLVLLLSLYGAALMRGADMVDGRADGRIGIIPLHRGVAPPPRR